MAKRKKTPPRSKRTGRFIKGKCKTRKARGKTSRRCKKRRRRR